MCKVPSSPGADLLEYMKTHGSEPVCVCLPLECGNETYEDLGKSLEANKLSLNTRNGTGSAAGCYSVRSSAEEQ